MNRRNSRGFTLIEVIIALLVVALGIGALLTTLTSSARMLGYLRDKSFAEWIALNRISEVRLSTSRPGVGVTHGTVEYAGQKWSWQQDVTDPGVAGMLRIDVHVALGDAPRNVPAAASDEDGPPPFAGLATAYGFMGTAVAPPSGIDPDWSTSAAAGPGGPGGRDGDGDGGGRPRGPGRAPR